MIKHPFEPVLASSSFSHYSVQPCATLTFGLELPENPWWLNLCLSDRSLKNLVLLDWYFFFQKVHVGILEAKLEPNTLKSILSQNLTVYRYKGSGFKKSELNDYLDTYEIFTSRICVYVLILFFKNLCVVSFC